MKTIWDPFRRLREPLERWWLRDVLGQVYRIEEHTVVCGKPQKEKTRIPIAQIQTWQIIQTMAGTYVELKTADGRLSSWPDRYDELVSLMKSAVPDRELPWIAE